MSTKVSEKARIKQAQRRVEAELKQQAEASARVRLSLDRLSREYHTRRDALLGPVMLQRLKDAAKVAAQHHESTSIAGDRHAKRALLATLYSEYGIDPAAVHRLDTEYRERIAALASHTPPTMPMHCVERAFGPLDHGSDGAAILNSLRGATPALAGVSRQTFSTPVGHATGEEFGLHDIHDLGAHSDMTEMSGVIGANVFTAHAGDYSGNGDSSSYARTTGVILGPVNITQTTNFLITAQVICLEQNQSAQTWHTPWWDPRDSDSIIDIRDTLILGINRNVSDLPFTSVGTGDLAHIYIREDDGVDDRVGRNPWTFLTFSTVLGVTPGDVGDCAYFFVGLREYFFIWAKYVKYALQSTARWNLVQVSVESV